MRSYCRYNRVENSDLYVIIERTQLVDLLIFAPKAINLNYKIIKTIVSDDSTSQNINLLLNTVQSKIDIFQKQFDAFDTQCFNQKTNVHVGGGLMVTYNDLMLKEDCCTDELQGELNDGWRIIAVCVQPDQRRPDYILGRYNPDLDVSRKKKADR